MSYGNSYGSNMSEQISANNVKKLNTDVDADQFASFIRDQTKKNYHLNFYTKHAIEKSSKIDLSQLRMFRFDKLTKEEIVVILSKCVIFSNEQFIVLNKPNGIAVQDGESQNISITEITDELSKALGFKERLHVVHRLDKDTTGVLILAKNVEIAFLFKEAFKKGQIRKNYLCLTHGLANPHEGIIDFHLKEKLVDNNVVIMPDVKYIRKSDAQRTKLKSISTAYRTIQSNYNISFMQCAMISGVKHQVRAHLAYGLETPIIGDHKYSWLMKSTKFPILPQVLSEPALAGLKIEAGKVRHLPVFLHAHQVIIGEPPVQFGKYDSKADLNSSKSANHQCRLPNNQIYANLPPFFISALKSLGFYNFKSLKRALKNIL